MKKKNYLTSYYRGFIKKLFISKFIYDSVNDIPKIRGLRLSIESGDVKKAHYLVAYIFSKGFLAYLKKYYIKKTTREYFSVKGNSFFFLDIKKYNLPQILYLLLYKLLLGNVSTEKLPFCINRKQTKIILWNTPVINELKTLELQNEYLPNIPLSLNFTLSLKKKSNTLSEKLFFLQTYSLINLNKSYNFDIKKKRNENTL